MDYEINYIEFVRYCARLLVHAPIDATVRFVPFGENKLTVYYVPLYDLGEKVFDNDYHKTEEITVENHWLPAFCGNGYVRFGYGPKTKTIVAVQPTKFGPGYAQEIK